ncbi:hypothetical protein BJX96DRAFT_155672 [Aspergillus floccosus]
MVGDTVSPCSMKTLAFTLSRRTQRQKRKNGSYNHDKSALSFINEEIWGFDPVLPLLIPAGEQEDAQSAATPGYSARKAGSKAVTGAPSITKVHKCNQGKDLWGFDFNASSENKRESEDCGVKRLEMTMKDTSLGVTKRSSAKRGTRSSPDS